MSRPTPKRKCKQCKTFFSPDPRCAKRHRYCSKAECRKASKAASQQRWLQKPANRDYFKGSPRVERVCYDIPGLPRPNNALESQFRDTNRYLMRTTGQKGLTKRTLQRQGAWELLPRPPTEAQLLSGLRHIPPEDLAQERQRFAEHRRRFRLQSRSRKQTQIQFEKLRQRWSTLAPTGTG